jgi:hypothetical protein
MEMSAAIAPIKAAIESLKEFLPQMKDTWHGRRSLGFGAAIWHALNKVTLPQAAIRIYENEGKLNGWSEHVSDKSPLGIQTALCTPLSLRVPIYGKRGVSRRPVLIAEVLEEFRIDGNAAFGKGSKSGVEYRELYVLRRDLASQLERWDTMSGSVQ